MPPRLYRFFVLFMILVVAPTACTSLPALIVDDFGAPMALVPAGEFSLGRKDGESNESLVQVIYLEDFYIDVYEVTNQRYAECVGDGVCVEPENTTFYDNAGYLDHPVIFVTWDMAQTYCQWRGGARLPSKVEWDKAARDELEVVDYYWGDESPVCQVGALMGVGIDENADFETGTEVVGSYDPNEFGLYDMTGNVWEWVEDWYGADYDPSSPSEGPAGLSNEEYSLSGGSGDATVSFLRMASWSGYGPVFRRYICGFRCARSP